MNEPTPLGPYFIFLDAAGQPAARSLGEMTAAEVFAAVAWAEAAVRRLAPGTEAALARAAEVMTEHDPRTAVARMTVAQDIKTLRAAGLAQIHHADLLAMVIAVIQPQWTQEHPELGLGAAVRQLWPR